MRLSLLLSILPLSALLLLSIQAEACERFEDCLRASLNNPDPYQKALSASQGILLWNKSLPQRDLANLLQMRAEALIGLHLSGKSSPRLLTQAQSDYERLQTLLPGNWMPTAGLARLAELQGQAMMAESLYAESVKTRALPAWLTRAEYYLRRFDTTRALADLDAADVRLKEMLAREEDVHPQFRGRLHLLRGQVLSVLRREAESAAELQSACELGIKEACP